VSSSNFDHRSKPLKSNLFIIKGLSSTGHPQNTVQEGLGVD
jgi:hypothetical protein